MPEMDVQSYKVSPVPQFLIEEAMEDKGESKLKVTSTEEVNKNTEVAMSMTEGEDVKQVKKRVDPYVTRPKLWYGGPWRKG